LGSDSGLGGAAALGWSSGQGGESWVEGGAFWWVDLAVWLDEDGSSFPADFDLPTVFMDEAMVIATEEDQILQIGETEIGPMLAMVAVEEVSLRAAGEATAPIPEPELPS
jgi:hypothetical protein